MYDRGLVSKKTVQTLMELHPGIEEANRDGEKKVDERWSVQDIVQMVQLGIMSVPTAQSLLGMDVREEADHAEAFQINDLNRLYARASGRHSKEMCDDCLHFREADNRCQAQDFEVPFDMPACVLFERKLTLHDCGCAKEEP